MDQGGTLGGREHGVVSLELFDDELPVVDVVVDPVVADGVQVADEPLVGVLLQGDLDLCVGQVQPDHLVSGSLDLVGERYDPFGARREAKAN